MYPASTCTKNPSASVTRRQFIPQTTDVPRANVSGEDVENADPSVRVLRPQAVEEPDQRVLGGRVARPERHPKLALDAVDHHEADRLLRCFRP